MVEGLRAYHHLLDERGAVLGLVSRGDRARLWDRHILDSVRAVRCLPAAPHALIDVGSGAGLPGIPLALARPDCSVVLVEANSRRAGFLEFAVDLLKLSEVRILVARAERLSIDADVVTMRAVADPAKAWSLAEHLIRSEGRLVHFSGRPVSSGTDSGSTGRDGSSQLDRPSAPTGTRSDICRAASFPGYGPVVIIRRAVGDPRVV